MKRSFERVLEKLNEAKFFLGLLGRSWDDPKSSYYFSAFASAARSVSFTLQAVCSELSEFPAYYAKHQKALQHNALARFLLEARNETQKVGIAPLARQGQALERTDQGRHYCRRLYRFIALDGGAAPPSGDAIALCSEHLKKLGELVQDCYSQFRDYLDPDAEYTIRVQKAVSISLLKAPRCPGDKMLAKYSVSLKGKKRRIR